ncbi:MAG: peptidoglycan-binding domain-containing protein [Candidatus Gracilibacteria bacterium]|nr:peptidoglycan-binding domain-containing protein [Candidatus Gracilibacteria bacterium]
MGAETPNLDFIKRDNHLTRDEIKEVKEMSKDEERLKVILDTQNAFEDFINTEYKWANQGYLRKGGKSVRELQRALGMSVVDGDFGKNTFLAVIKFQRENGLTVDGLAGPNTQEKLFQNQNKKHDILSRYFREKREKVKGTTNVYTESDNLDSGKNYAYLNGVDFRSLAYKYPREASLKNNNPAGLTYNQRFAGTLKKHNIVFFKGTARPSSEGGYYFGFPNMEEGMKAYNILWNIKLEKMANKTFGDLASNWAVDTRSYRRQFSDVWNSRVADLSEEQIDLIKMNQMRIESPGMYAELQNVGFDFDDTSKVA